MIKFLFKYEAVANEKAYFKTGKYAEPYVSEELNIVKSSHTTFRTFTSYIS